MHGRISRSPSRPTRGMRMLSGLGVAVSLSLGSGCEGERTDGSAVDGPGGNDGNPASSEASEEESESQGGLGTLIEETDRAVLVHLSISPDDPPRAGPLELEGRTDQPLEGSSEPVVDIFAPHMPAHGIIRFPAKIVDGEQITSEVEVPMEGLWTFYVDLGDEVGTASFEVQIAPEEGGEAPHRHHSPGEHEHSSEAEEETEGHDHHFD